MDNMELCHSSDDGSNPSSRSKGCLKGALAALPYLLAKNKARYAAMREAYSSSPNRCIGCGAALAYEKKRQDFCSHSCCARKHNCGIARNGASNPWCGKDRPCESCGNTNPNYEARYCSRVCHKNAIYDAYIARWKNGEEDGMCGHDSTSKQIERYLRAVHGNACQKCGWDCPNLHTGKVPLQIHHKDGDYRNNKEENLELLCPNCHSLTETFGSRNKGSGREYRKAWRIELKRRVSLVGKIEHS